MHFGIPATFAGQRFAVVPAAFFAVRPGGFMAPMGFFNVGAGFPFGVPFSFAGSTFIAIPAAALATAPAVI